jgi:hypothetical protein
MTMKSKLQIQALAASFILLVSLAATSAQPLAPDPRGPYTDPATGLPIAPVPAASAGNPQHRLQHFTNLPAVAPAPIDPATGLPLPPPAPPWMDDNWSDPNIVLTNVSYDGLPLSEVARDLRERFKGQFDILPMPKTFDREWGNEITFQLQLKNVRASEVFNAMNLVFENDRTPVRWELKASGHPLVLLRVLPEAAPQPAPENTHQATPRMVYFVGNLVGDEKSGGMTMEQIIKTIEEIWPADLGKPEEVIQFHKEAQMLIVNGTRIQVDFIQQTLQALGRKADLSRPKDNDLKDLEELGKVLQKEPYSNILKTIFNSGQK